MALLLNGNGSGSDELIGSFESGAGQVSPSRDFADVFTVESVEPLTEATFQSVQSEQQAVVETQEEKGIGDFITDIFGNVIGSVQTTVEAAAQGAIEGATAASQGAETGAQIGARTTTLGTTLSTTTLLLGALILVLLLRR